MIYTVQLTGVTPLIYGRPFRSTKADNEGADVFEARVWKERAYINAEGFCTYPAFAIKRTLEQAAKYRGDKIKGRGSKTFTQVFKSAVLIMPDEVNLGRKESELLKLERFVPSNPSQKNSGRVWRFFPQLPAPWGGTIQIQVMDPKIDEKVLEQHLTTAGVFCGFGTWRAENGGSYGRFASKIIKVERDEGVDPPEVQKEETPVRRKRETVGV